MERKSNFKKVTTGDSEAIKIEKGLRIDRSNENWEIKEIKKMKK